MPERGFCVSVQPSRLPGSLEVDLSIVLPADIAAGRAIHDNATIPQPRQQELGPGLTIFGHAYGDVAHALGPCRAVQEWQRPGTWSGWL